MEKQQALEYIRRLAVYKIITKAELLAAFDKGTGVTSDATPHENTSFFKKLTIAEILYYIGGAIVFLGISILVAQNWSTFNSFTRVITTLGSGIGAYFMGVLLTRREPTKTMSAAFFFLSALLLPIGLTVVVNEAGYDVGQTEWLVFLTLLLTGVYASSFLVFQRSLFTVFSIIFGTWFFFTITDLLLDGSLIWGSDDFWAYRFLVVGLTWLLLGHSFAQKPGPNYNLKGLLYGFGIWTFLAAAFFLGGWSPDQNVFWELLFPGLAFGTMFLSIPLKSGAFLIFGSLYLMAYIIKITAEYFSTGLGWPLALVLAGFMLIGVGYFSLYLRNRYLKRPA